MKPEVKEILDNLHLALSEIDSMCYLLIMAEQGNTQLFDDVIKLRDSVRALKESIYGKNDVSSEDGYQFEEIFFSLEMISVKNMQKFIGHSDVKTTLNYVTPTDKDIRESLIR